MEKLPVNTVKRFPKPLLFAIAIPGALALSLLAQETLSPKASQTKQTIKSALTGSWKVTGFEDVKSAPNAWDDILGAAYLGYSATCEDVAKLEADAGGKGGEANNARRHPIFELWLFHRNTTITPAKVRHDLQKLQSSPLQRAMPKLVGFNKKFVVTCLYDCSESVVANVASSLKLENGQNSTEGQR
jgi:hypothetical protein